MAGLNANRLRQRQPPWRSQDYLDFVRSRNCVVTGLEPRRGNDIVAHHVRCLGGGGMAMKPPDYYCVPLLAIEHVTLHSIGEETYWKTVNRDPQTLICMTLMIYIAHHPDKDLFSRLIPIVTGVVDNTMIGN